MSGARDVFCTYKILGGVHRADTARLLLPFMGLCPIP
nr:MAG TPA: hypothetical protein [Caudoviricetes sp.]